MRTGADVPAVYMSARLSEVMREMSQKGLGATAIIGEDRQVLGVFTDGDLRRLIEKGIDLRELTAADVMHPNPTTLRDTALAAEAAQLMELKRITSVLVVNTQAQLCGVVNSNDLMRAKVI
jgi:arabinose-5-phosphate isomerase